jgi:PEP-CTERM motif-containing protein
MSKRILGIALGAFALIGLAPPTPAAAAPPAATSIQGCDYGVSGFPNQSQSDDKASGTSGSCSIMGGSGSLISDPTVMLQASANASSLPPINRSGTTVQVSIDYFFTVTGGVLGTPVPIVIDSNMITSATPSNDANNGNVAEAHISLFGLNSSLQRVSDDGAADACAFSPVGCANPSSFSGGLSLTVASGATEEIDLRVIAAVSANQRGQAFASIDPAIFVDPTFVDASLYSVELSPGVGNGLPGTTPAVPEPAAWSMLLIGFAGLAGVGYRKAKKPRAA